MYQAAAKDIIMSYRNWKKKKKERNTHFIDSNIVVSIIGEFRKPV